MKRLAGLLVALVCMFGAVPKKAYTKPTRSKAPTVDHWPGCKTRACDARVGKRIHRARVYDYVERKVDRITPYRCYRQPSVVPCYIITRESKGDWTVLNTWTSGVPCWRRACGFYQFLGWNVPWPVIVRSRYETLKRKLAHHRQARELWYQQQYQGACHWCGG